MILVMSNEITVTATAERAVLLRALRTRARGKFSAKNVTALYFENFSFDGVDEDTFMTVAESIRHHTRYNW